MHSGQGEAKSPQAKNASICKGLAQEDRTAKVRHEKILLVEESGPTRRLVRGMLRDLDYVHVEEAHDTDTAEKLLKGHAFDLVLLDWRPPRMDGIGLLGRMRASESPIVAMTPVIVVSAGIDLSTLQKAAELGAHSVLTKPFSLRVLKSHLEAIGADRRLPSTRQTQEPAAPAAAVAFAPRKKPAPAPAPETPPVPDMPATTNAPDESDIFYV
ncbi:MAG: hypothetical protein CMN87_16380 [Stappia sp.]|nr:hypothetical protein [Stappia sp.]MBM21583.1 hypothetical protein [Stappia sp.]|tara:strand:+ start:1029 stop:1667 length:639 start_codon:yes stop_codon:yes gene_type:complete